MTIAFQRRLKWKYSYDSQPVQYETWNYPRHLANPLAARRPKGGSTCDGLLRRSARMHKAVRACLLLDSLREEHRKVLDALEDRDLPA